MTTSNANNAANLITAELIKQLRDNTGAPMMKCREALVAENGDLEKATDWLRKYSVSLASKKSDREVSEGICSYAFSDDGAAIALISARCETDFVARNKEFCDLAEFLVENGVNKANSLDELLNTNIDNNKVSDIIVGKIAKIGENIAIKDYKRLQIDKRRSVVGVYVHGSTLESPRSGRIVTAVLLGIDVAEGGNAHDLSADASSEMKNFAREVLAKHIAASNCLCIDISEVPNDVLQREKDIYLEEIRQKHGDKPQPVLDKIIEGKVRKFFEENVLLEQAYVFEPEKTIRQKISELSAKLNLSIRVGNFVKMAIVKK